MRFLKKIADWLLGVNGAHQAEMEPVVVPVPVRTDDVVRRDR